MIYLFMQVYIWILLALILGTVIGWFVWGKPYKSLVKDHKALNDTLNEFATDAKNAVVLKQSLTDEKLANSTLDIEIGRLNNEIKSLEKKLKDCSDQREKSLKKLQQTEADNERLKKNNSNLSDSLGSPSISSLKNNNRNKTEDRASFGLFDKDNSKHSQNESSKDDAKIDIKEEFKPTSIDKPAGKLDDLTKIKGIGPKIQDTLHELGIFKFKQIAEFNPDNVLWVDHYLDFKGRINKEEWIEQAKTLSQGDKTEFSSRQ